MDNPANLNIKLLNRLLISLMVYCLVLFGVFVLSPKAMLSLDMTVLRWFGQHYGIFSSISKNSQFSNIAQTMLILNFFVSFLVLLVINRTGLLEFSVKSENVWKHFLSSISILAVLYATIYFDMSDHSCSTPKCKLYDRMFDSEIGFSLYLTFFSLTFGLAASQLFYCVSKLLFNKKIE